MKLLLKRVKQIGGGNSRSALFVLFAIIFAIGAALSSVLSKQNEFDAGSSSATAVTCGSGNIKVEATNSANDTSYSTLGAAFAAINLGTHTGAISIGVCGNTTETTSAALKASGSGSPPSSYTSITISPIGARTISGTVGGGALINLNGASNVTIDGLNTGGNSLTIKNTSTSATAGVSTIRFINGASNNVVTRCSVLGSSTAPVTTAGGNILFSTTTTTGNNNNTVSFCNLGPAGTNLPTKVIMGLGSSTAKSNSGNLIDHNNIYDFFSPTNSVS